MSSGALLASGSLAQLRLQANLSAVFNLQGSDLNFPDFIEPEKIHTNSSAGLYHLAVAMDKKMELIKHLASQTGLKNMDISLPTLEDIYTHIIKNQTVNEAI